MLYLSPLCCLCGSPSVHFNSVGIIVHSDRGTTFPAYLPTSHSYCLLGQVSCFTPKEMINQKRPKDYQWASSQISQTYKATSILILTVSIYVSGAPKLKFSSINNIHSLSFTISQQWGCRMNVLDSADIQLWWSEWWLSVQNAFCSSLLVCLFLAYCLQQ